MKSFACLSVIYCKLAGKRAMGASILLGSNHKGRVLFDVPRFEEVSSQFFRTYRMTVHQFDNLLHLLTPVISKQINNYRESISAEERFVITLR